MGCEGSKNADTKVNHEKPLQNETRKQSSPTQPLKNVENGTIGKPIDICEEEKEKDKTGEESSFPEPVEIPDIHATHLLGVTEDSKIEEMLARFGENELFVDEEFKADQKALFYSGRVEEDVVWLRPKDIVKEGQIPHLTVDGVTRDDIKQGILGDCWFLSSCAAVSVQERFMNKIIGKNQVLCGNGYKGIVHFCMWRFGEWVDVYIDDLLPTKDGKLFYAKSEDPTEFWPPLIEKAYAKLHGSYEAIEGGQTMDALVDLTGGLAERCELKEVDVNKFKHFHRAHQAGAFIACSRKGDWTMSIEADPNGLVSGHAYSITDLATVTVKRPGAVEIIERLLRIRNPWGNETEWRGAWSDDDENWQWLDEKTREKLHHISKGDGEFWMRYEDFCSEFSEVTICTLGPDFDGDGVTDQAGHIEKVKGEWKKDISAGGCRNDLASFATNPQYLLTLTEPDDFDSSIDDLDDEGKCSVVIALMQEHRRSQRHLGVKMLQIGFVIYKTEDPENRLPEKHFRYNYDTGKSGVYINYREVSGRFQLEPGHYIVIPSTFNKNDTGSFLMRFFAQKKFTVKKM
ncbi:calpain-A [Lingula anatina]|uniref:Calpain-A n=1 Tax=Lingula anatina TaxID=7574 RepID=A0A1S3KH35_LINAN|nr:calpain-A [Lingula anatina]|eukprot:XP_013421779.1 calpain-A [Lingula anatina]